MFTGIIETTGIVSQILVNGLNKSFWIRSAISSRLEIDQSVSHNGVCLTVEARDNDLHKVTAVRETLNKTNLETWKEVTLINLEQCLKIGDRLDGHIVQGHVDTPGIVKEIKQKNNNCEIEIGFPKKFARLIVEKGSVCVDGVSLTAFDVKKKSFTVTIIPYTLEHTNLRFVKEGTLVNLEFDILGKYLQRNLSLS